VAVKILEKNTTLAVTRRNIAGVPQGYDAFVLADLLRDTPDSLLHIVLDDAAMERLADILAFVDPGIEVLKFPAWDTLPYDRVSPNPALIARRLDTLTELASIPPRKRIVLTTVNAASQRIPPRKVFATTSFIAKKGARIDLEAFKKFLANNGYHRTETVREAGDYAIRGGIIDLFSSSSEEPIRLDFFGDELENIRSFDPLSQRTTSELTEIVLKPTSEIFLDPESIARFRAAYRQAFGAVLDDDPLYLSISEGRRFAGMEHWLPFFHEHMETIFDYVPNAWVTLDPQIAEARAERLGEVEDFYQARVQRQTADKKAKQPQYKPIPPDNLFILDAEWKDLLEQRTVINLAPFAAAESAQSAPGTENADGRRTRDFAEARNRPDINLFDAVRDYLAGLIAGGKRTLITAYSAGSAERLAGVLRDHGIEPVEQAEDWGAVQSLPLNTVALAVLPIESGFTAPRLTVLTEQDILGDRLARPKQKRRRSDKFTIDAASLASGDLIVHVEHGIGRYAGLETLEVSGAPHECLRIIYDGNDKLFVPVENIDVISRYGSEDLGVALDRLGGAGWQSRRARIKKRLKDMAEALLRIAAQRHIKQTDPLPLHDGPYNEFAAAFPYNETEDQLRAIENVIEDLGSGKPMDRLVCGDVGFGKTEVALRAAFVAAMAGKQVAVVVPTTLLCRQHFRNFSQRFGGLGLQVAQLSRLVNAAEAKRVKEDLAAGRIDIVIGTHALFGKGVTFGRLGLVIVDEEQHFGVKQKERLKELTDNVHVLTLTATPIPRTLQLALTGVRELSLIATPPVDRLAVRTFVLPYDAVTIREALLRERFRGGQSFYVCPRLEDLAEVEQQLRELVPELSLITAHGQLTPTELEDRIGAFYEGKHDLLLSTNIVESGLDIPRANTMIIHRAELFGLAQLYQLRGRIGRSKLRGYAYLTYEAGKKLTAGAEQRLKVIETLDTLGAGFQLASHDLDLRGAGNLLGEEQSGHIREVGIELYQQMLEDAVTAAREGANVERIAAHDWTPQINLGLSIMIPECYVPDLTLRMSLYRRIGDMKEQADIDAFAVELVDRFGKLPPEVDNLLQVVSIKQLCRAAHVEKIDAGPKGVVIAFHNNTFPRVDRLADFVMRNANAIKLRPDQRLVYLKAWADPRARMKGIEDLLGHLGRLLA
jgi:transcription-repair coupling factor (superfamily II helicase)